MRHILAALAMILALPSFAAAAPASPPPSPPIVGSWRSIDDAKSTVEVRVDGTWIDRYQGEPSATAASRWQVFSGAHPPKEAADQTLDPKSEYLEVSDPDAGPLFYSLDLVGARKLELTYLARGNTLTYDRMGVATAKRRKATR